MNMTSFRTRIFVVVWTALAVAGCGGGGGAAGPSGGIDRLGVSTGAVTGFGSIIVNGVRYETSSTSFDIDDDSSSSSQDDLSVGDIVVVTYDQSNPTVAVTVIGDEAVEGPVNSVNVTAGTLVVAGQSVLTDAGTSFDDSNGVQSLADIQQDDFVEVSGFFDADGTIRATRIEKKAASGESEIHGIVSGKTASTFMINALEINYTSVPAIIDDDFSNGTFNNGDLVEVKGTNYLSATLLATKVEPDGLGVGEGGTGVDFDDFDDAEVEGFITRFASARDFDVTGVPVTTDSGTQFEGGTTADLGLNVKVEVEGAFNAAGVLVADKVDIRRSNDVRVVALVDAVDTGAGTLSVLGITARIDAQTRLEDQSDADIESFALDDINVGDYVEVRGGADSGAAEILALIVEREDVPDVAGEDTELRAQVEAINRPLLTIAGVTVDTSGAEFRNVSDAAISADTFFATVQVGDLVDADGFQTGTTSLDADEVELED
jgi:Domain of unknown function (DUF5666)